MKRFLFSIIFLITFSVFVFSQTDEPKKFEIFPCSPKLTESGRQSSFRFGYRYAVLTNEDGTIKKVTSLTSKYESKHLADSSEVIPCIEKMKLSPSSKYIILISYGTTSDKNFLRILNKFEEITINL